MSWPRPDYRELFEYSIATQYAMDQAIWKMHPDHWGHKLRSRVDRLKLNGSITISDAKDVLRRLCR